MHLHTNMHTHTHTWLTVYTVLYYIRWHEGLHHLYAFSTRSQEQINIHSRVLGLLSQIIWLYPGFLIWLGPDKRLSVLLWAAAWAKCRMQTISVNSIPEYMQMQSWYGRLAFSWTPHHKESFLLINFPLTSTLSLFAPVLSKMICCCFTDS